MYVCMYNYISSEVDRFYNSSVQRSLNSGDIDLARRIVVIGVTSAIELMIPNCLFVGLPVAAEPIRPSTQTWHLTNLGQYRPPGKRVPFSSFLLLQIRLRAKESFVERNKKE